MHELDEFHRPIIIHVKKGTINPKNSRYLINGR